MAMGDPRRVRPAAVGTLGGGQTVASPGTPFQSPTQPGTPPPVGAVPDASQQYRGALLRRMQNTAPNGAMPPSMPPGNPQMQLPQSGAGPQVPTAGDGAPPDAASIIQNLMGSRMRRRVLGGGPGAGV